MIPAPHKQTGAPDKGANGLTLRAPETVMRLSRMGASFPTRLSFMRALLRRAARENWRFEKLRFDVDENGYGESVFAVHTGARTYSLVVFTNYVPPEKRTDRVIAEIWDATFNLFDGVPADDDIARLRENTPKQEAGRFLSSELVLGRANKSLRMFDHVVQSLAQGVQPDMRTVTSVGYLMRTSAVYGSGKFGCADYENIAGRAEFQGPFQAELLAVYLFRWFTFELAEHVARAVAGPAGADDAGPAGAAALAPEIKRYMGVGNSTGLGMAPFMAGHPMLINAWVTARETALARVRAQPRAAPGTIAAFRNLTDLARRHVREWNVEDARQMRRIETLRAETDDLAAWAASGGAAGGATSAALNGPAPWDAAFKHAEQSYSEEGQELTVSLLIEAHGDLVDDLAETMHTAETPELDPAMSAGQLRALIKRDYAWALEIDFTAPGPQQKFWYYSEEKLEPRFGDRFTEPGADYEMPVAAARDVAALYHALKGEDETLSVGRFLIRCPEHRRAARRAQAAARRPYAEIRDNLIDESVRPVDLLRFKLAFFGAVKFDPKSDLWTRINMYHGAPLPGELDKTNAESWIFPTAP